MAFKEEMKIFTDKGYKNIEDLSGQDKVLARNFIGDAEFIQPFALRKSMYIGDIYKIGGRNWSFSVTPDHVVVYDRDDMPVGKNITYLPAKDLEINLDNRIYRKFRYLCQNEYKKEQIIIYSKFGKRFSTISNEDWFALCASVILKGQIDRVSSKRPALQIYFSEEKSEQQISFIGDILDRIGVDWSVLKRDRYFIRVSNNNNLAQRVATRLSADKRKDMYLSDKMIYNSRRPLADIFFKTLLNDSTQYACSKKLAESLILFGTLNGYGITYNLAFPKGSVTARATLTRDIYKVHISNPVESYSPTSITTEQYKGNVYEIDLFDGQVYVKDKGMPVWINPK